RVRACFPRIRRRRCSAHFPYTTLFRSDLRAMPVLCRAVAEREWDDDLVVVSPDAGFAKKARAWATHLGASRAIVDKIRSDHRCRSEEHTSELQSRENLVCRLLLEKKKQ